MIKSIVDRLMENRIYADMSIEEILYESTKSPEYKERNKEFQVGDIVLTKYYSSSSHQTVSAHRILVITNKKDSRGFTQYEGFPLKSVHSGNDKSNRSEKGYPNSLFIDNYSSILVRGEDVPYPPNKEAFIDVKDLGKFRDYDVSPQKSSYAGHVTDEFMRFVKTAYDNYKSGKDNSRMRWINNRGGIYNG